MGGSGATLFHWNFVFTDQSDRVDLIQKIYGVEVKTHPKYSLAYGRYTWCKMLENKYMDICDPLKNHVQKLIDADDQQAAQIDETTGESGAHRYSDAQRAQFAEFKSALSTLKKKYSSASSEAKKAANHKGNSLNSVTNSLLDQMIKVQDLAIAVAKSFNYTRVKNISVNAYPNDTYHSSPWALDFWDSKKYNEIRVNFN